MPDEASRILMIGFPALVLVYSAVCIAALRPRTGTLDWIPACDRPAPLLLGHSYPVRKKDILFLAAVCVLTCLLRAAGFPGTLAGAFSLPPGQLTLALLKYAGVPAAAAALAWLVMKRLYGQTLAVSLCAVLIAADFSADPVSTVFSAAALFFLVHYLTVPEQAGFRRTAVPLAGGFVSLAAGCYFDPALLLMLPAALFLCVMGCIDRFITAGKLWLSSCLTAAILSLVLAWIVIFIPAGMDEGYRFPSLLVEGGYYLMVLQRLGDGFSMMSSSVSALRLPADWPLLLAALPALVSAVVWLVRDHNRPSLLVLAWTVMQCLTFVLLGSHALSLACALCLCQVWSRLEENRYLWLAYAGTGILLVCLLLPHFLPLF